MKKIIIILFVALSSSSVGQDILVLKKDESEIKCKILSINDTLVTYNLWKSPDYSNYSLKRSEILSFMYDKKNYNKDIRVVPYAVLGGAIGVGIMYALNNDKDNSHQKNIQKYADAGFIGKYKSGELVRGYVVGKNSDTTEGILAIGNVALNQLVVNFTDEKGKNRVYNTDSIIAYGYDDVHYQLKETGYTKEVTNNYSSEKGMHFLHLEVDGPAKLYRFYTLKFKKSTLYSDPNPPMYFGKLKIHYLIINPSGKQMITKGRSVKGSVLSLLNDDKILMEKINTKGLKSRDLPENIRSYNERYLNKK